MSKEGVDGFDDGFEDAKEDVDVGSQFQKTAKLTGKEGASNYIAGKFKTQIPDLKQRIAIAGEMARVKFQAGVGITEVFRNVEMLPNPLMHDIFKEVGFPHDGSPTAMKNFFDDVKLANGGDVGALQRVQKVFAEPPQEVLDTLVPQYNAVLEEVNKETKDRSIQALLGVGKERMMKALDKVPEGIVSSERKQQIKGMPQEEQMAALSGALKGYYETLPDTDLKTLRHAAVKESFLGQVAFAFCEMSAVGLGSDLGVAQKGLRELREKGVMQPMIGKLDEANKTYKHVPLPDDTKKQVSELVDSTEKDHKTFNDDFKVNLAKIEGMVKVFDQIYRASPQDEKLKADNREIQDKFQQEKAALLKERSAGNIVDPKKLSDLSETMQQMLVKKALDHPNRGALKKLVDGGLDAKFVPDGAITAEEQKISQIVEAPEPVPQPVPQRRGFFQKLRDAVNAFMSTSGGLVAKFRGARDSWNNTPTTPLQQTTIDTPMTQEVKTSPSIDDVSTTTNVAKLQSEEKKDLDPELLAPQPKLTQRFDGEKKDPSGLEAKTKDSCLLEAKSGLTQIDLIKVRYLGRDEDNKENPVNEKGSRAVMEKKFDESAQQAQFALDEMKNIINAPNIPASEKADRIRYVQDKFNEHNVSSTDDVGNLHKQHFAQIVNEAAEKIVAQLPGSKVPKPITVEEKVKDNCVLEVLGALSRIDKTKNDYLKPDVDHPISDGERKVMGQAFDKYAEGARLALQEMENHLKWPGLSAAELEKRINLAEKTFVDKNFREPNNPVANDFKQKFANLVHETAEKLIAQLPKAGQEEEKSRTMKSR